MKISLIALAVTAAVCAGVFGTGRALATTTTHSAARTTLTVAMRDPGCHWFLRHGKYTTTASVQGRVRIVNRDEATLKLASRHGTKRIMVGKSLVVGRGSYVIMMVGQAPDDNYLKLTVR